MAAACNCDYLPPSRRDLPLTKEDVHGSRKRFKSSAPSGQDESLNLPMDTKCKSEAQEESGSSLNSKHSPIPSCSSSEPELSSQGGEPENNGKNCKRDEVFATDDYYYEESDPGEDEDGISIEELQKTPGWLLFVKNVDRHFERKNFGNQ